MLYISVASNAKGNPAGIENPQMLFGESLL
jgi:hypothetical protein